jgi:hypothetical protein
MACNSCKKRKKENIEDLLVEEKKDSKFTKIKKYTLKSVLFFILLVAIAPLVIVGYVIAMFNIIVLSKGINIYPLLNFIGKKIFKNDDDDDDEDDDDEEEEDDDEDWDEEEYELENPNDIIVLK